MPVKPRLFVLALSLTTLCLTASAKAADTSPLSEMDQEIAQRYGGRIAEMFAKEHRNVPVKIDANAEKAVGLYNPDTNEGIIAVPKKELKEDPQNKEVEKEHGQGVCYLFMSPTFNPLVDGKPVDAKKLLRIKLKGRNGDARDITCFVCSVKHNEGDDWQILLFGADKEPVIKASVGRDDDAAKGDLVLTIKEPKDNRASLVFNLFGKFSAAIAIANKQK